MGSATIRNYPDMKTVGYAELWSADSFVIVANDWWPHMSLPSESKGDERNIGARYKIDIPARCWVFWEGTATESGRRVLQVQQAADGHPLDNPPGAGFLPIEAGVNVIAFGEGEPEPEPPEPEPEEPMTLDEWLARFLDAPGYNDCQGYGVAIEHVQSPAYQVIGVHHLTGAENNGNHNLYVDVLTEDGGPDPGANVLIRNQGGDWRPLENGPRGIPLWDTPLFKDDKVDVTLADSDIVTGISTAHPDEDEGNTLYHHSFYVVFQKVAPQPEIPGLPPGWVPNSIHLYFGGVGDSPVVSYYVEAQFVTIGIQREHYLKLWKGLEQELMEAIGDCQTNHHQS